MGQAKIKAVCVRCGTVGPKRSVCLKHGWTTADNAHGKACPGCTKLISAERQEAYETMMRSQHQELKVINLERDFQGLHPLEVDGRGRIHDGRRLRETLSMISSAASLSRSRFS